MEYYPPTAGTLMMMPPILSHPIPSHPIQGYRSQHMRFEEDYLRASQILPYEMNYCPPQLVYEDIGYNHVPLCGRIVSSAHSSAEQVNCDKSRQLPCKTFLSVGCCPYRDRCVYIHDPRLASVSSKSKSRKKNKEDPDHVIDSFYWPALPRSELNYSLHAGKNKPDHGPKTSVFQMYIVPSSFAGYSGGRLISHSVRKFNDNDAMYSMWNYFVEVCQKNSEQELRLRGSSNNCSIAEVDDHDPPDAILNRLTHCKRLPIFVSLATTDCHDEGDECSIEEDLKLDCIPCDRTLCITSPPHHLCYQDHDPCRISPISVVNATSALLSPIRPSFSSKTLHCYSH